LNNSTARFSVNRQPDEVSDRDTGPRRPLLVAFLALVLDGMVLLGIEREATEIDFQFVG
jgi:hypothetical protein